VVLLVWVLRKTLPVLEVGCLNEVTANTGSTVLCEGRTLSCVLYSVVARLKVCRKICTTMTAMRTALQELHVTSGAWYLADILHIT
jgi:hypothetical protein